MGWLFTHPRDVGLEAEEGVFLLALHVVRHGLDVLGLDLQHHLVLPERSNASLEDTNLPTAFGSACPYPIQMFPLGNFLGYRHSTLVRCILAEVKRQARVTLHSAKDDQDV